MTQIKSLASQAMTELLTWRNGPDSEISSRVNLWKHRGRILATELGLAPIIALSLIETFAYQILTTCFAFITPFTVRPFKFFAKLCVSSSITFSWAFVNAAFFNFKYDNLITEESEAFNVFSNFLRPSNRQINLNNNFNYSPPHSPDLSQAKNMSVTEGANFLIEEVLVDTSVEKIERFKEADPTIFSYILNKMVFIYTLGSKAKDSLPNNLKKETKEKIEILRDYLLSKSPDQLSTIRQDIHHLIEKEEKCTIEEESKETQEVFKLLIAGAGEELQGSEILMRWIQRAVEFLEASDQVEVVYPNLAIKFLIENVLKNESLYVLNAFKNEDESIPCYILNKTILTYAIGSQIEQSLPDFLDHSLQTKIKELRAVYSVKTPAERLVLSQKLELAIKQKIRTELSHDEDYSDLITQEEWVDFSIENESKEVKELFNEIIGIMHATLQGNQFINSNWKAVIGFLNSR